MSEQHSRQAREPGQASTGAADFEALLLRHRGEIQLHCYRMLGSLEDAEDVTQETSLRAWRGMDSFGRRSSFRTWIYRIATNACLDHLRGQARRRRPAVGADGFAAVPAQVAVPWLQPYPDAAGTADASVAADPAGAAASEEPGPAQQVLARDAVRLAFVAAVQYLSPRQRGLFLLRDCLGWPVGECAEALQSSSAAVNSALQRARATMRAVLGADPALWTDPAPGGLRTEEHDLVTRYIDAIESADDARIASLLREDVRVSHAAGAGGNSTGVPVWYAGRRAVVDAWHPVLHAEDHPELLMVPVRMNAQSGVATYLRMPGYEEFEAFALNTLTAVDGAIAEVASFPADLFGHFGLPARGSAEALRLTRTA